MRHTTWLKAPFGVCLVALGFIGHPAFPQEKDPPVKQVAVGRNVSVEIEDKKVVRVVIQAHVCLRKGSLEHLLTRRHGKEHEAILAADIDARDLHTGLLLAGAGIGKPVVFRPKALPPSGPAVKITLAYVNKEGKRVKVPAQQWIRHAKTKKDLQHDWVFVGSYVRVAEDDPAMVYYAANNGDVICVANFEEALLDVSILSPSLGENDYEAHTERIPPEGTSVLVILEPVRAKKK